MKRTRMLPVILCVAVVVVAAALVWHQQTAQPVLDPLLAETLSVSDQEQKSLSNAVQTIDQTDSADGLAVTVKQAITYPQMLCLLVELTYPDPIDPATLPEDDSILPSSYTVTVNGTPIGGHSSCLLPAWDNSKTEPANTFPFRICFLSDAPFFEQGQTCTLTLRDFPLQSDALLSVSWTTEALGEAIQVPLNGENVTGNATLTPLSLQVSVTGTTYDSLEALYRALSFQGKKGDTVPLEGTLTGNMGRSGDRPAVSVELKCHLTSYLAVDKMQAIQIGAEVFPLSIT